MSQQSTIDLIKTVRTLYEFCLAWREEHENSMLYECDPVRQEYMQGTVDAYSSVMLRMQTLFKNPINFDVQEEDKNGLL